jgi:hypothetical protein
VKLSRDDEELKLFASDIQSHLETSSPVFTTI